MADLATSNIVLQTAATGELRVHRDTCKIVIDKGFVTVDGLIGEHGEEMGKLTRKNIEALASAKFCTTCKPKGAQTTIDQFSEILAGWPEDEGSDTFEEHRALLNSSGDNDDEPVNELEDMLGEALVTPSEEAAQAEDDAVSDDDDLIGDVPTEVNPLEGVKVSKHYDDALIKVGLPKLDGTHENFKDLALEAFEALKKWRRADEEYKALPPQDTKWVTSTRYAWERDFLLGYFSGVVGQRPVAHFSRVGNLAARRGAAAAKAFRTI